MIIDWLECTILHRSQVRVLGELKSLFVEGGWTDLERGAMGYDHAAQVFRSGRVFWSSTRFDMGVHVVLPASALMAAGVSSLSLLVDLYLMGGKFSRIDFAADDFRGDIDLSVVEAHARGKLFVTRFRETADRGRWTITENEAGGFTIAFGSRVSDSYIRIYDKGAKEHTCSHWVRVELELKHERAEAAGRWIYEHREGEWGKDVAGWMQTPPLCGPTDRNTRRT